MFTINKPDGSLRSLADLRELNKRIKRNPFPIPKIQEMLLKLEGFMFATSLDLNMGYYHLSLTPNAPRLCTVVLPWRKYEYLRLPMGLCNSPNIFQEKMSELMIGLEFARAYLDNLLIISKTDFNEHLEHLEVALNRLSEAGLKINVSKCSFCQAELEYLGYWITRNGIKPTSKKVEAILKLTPPTKKKELRQFIGMINYYRDIWPQRSHILAPLTDLTSENVPCGSCEVRHPWWETGPTWVCTEYSTVGSRETIMTDQCMWEPRQYSQYSLVGKLVCGTNGTGESVHSTKGTEKMKSMKRGLDVVSHNIEIEN